MRFKRERRQQSPPPPRVRLAGQPHGTADVAGPGPSPATPGTAAPGVTPVYVDDAPRPHGPGPGPVGAPIDGPGPGPVPGLVDERAAADPAPAGPAAAPAAVPGRVTTSRTGHRKQARPRRRRLPWPRRTTKTMPEDVAATTVPGLGEATADLVDDGLGPGVLKSAPRRSKILSRMGFYEIHSGTITTSTRQAEALNPALVSTHMPWAGPMVGMDVGTGNAVSCSPHELYADGRITAPNVVVLGNVGSAKSSLVKTYYVARQVACGRQVAVFDRKNQEGRGEYVDVARICDGTTVTFSRTKGTAINLLDPRISKHSRDKGGDSRVGQDRLLLMAAEFAHGGQLTSKETHCLRIAHESALSRAQDQGRHATIRDVIAALQDPLEDAIDPKLSEADVVTRVKLMKWGLDIANDLARFVDGDLSGLIDGDTSTDIDWDASLLVFDTSEIEEDSPALSLIMALTATFLSSVWSAAPGQRLIVLEEGYHTTRLTGPGTTSVATILRSLVKRGRGIGLVFVTVIHHISDIPPDSDAMSLVREAGLVHIYAQTRDDDQQRATEFFGLPAWSRTLLGQLEKGVHVLKIGNEPARQVRHLRTPLEEGFTETDHAMHGEALGE